jgi:hypothetical protein
MTGGVTVIVSRGTSNEADRHDPNGIRFKSLLVVLINTGAPISSSEDLDELRLRFADRRAASLSFKPLKSANNGVDGMFGDADALLAWRTTFGDKKVCAGGYVADRGVHGDGKGSAYGDGGHSCGETPGL